jgi:hypothetical protein
MDSLASRPSPVAVSVNVSNVFMLSSTFGNRSPVRLQTENRKHVGIHLVSTADQLNHWTAMCNLTEYTRPALPELLNHAAAATDKVDDENHQRQDEE